jgi:hypothetical protein
VKKEQSPIANREELIELAISKKKGVSHEDLNDLLRCIIEYMEIKIKKDSVPAFLFPTVGYIFSTLNGAKKQMTLTNPPNISQIRYERIQKMLMNQDYFYGNNTLSSEELFSYFKRVSKLTIQEIETLQNE